MIMFRSKLFLYNPWSWTVLNWDSDFHDIFTKHGCVPPARGMSLVCSGSGEVCQSTIAEVCHDIVTYDSPRDTPTEKYYWCHNRHKYQTWMSLVDYSSIWIILGWIGCQNMNTFCSVAENLSCVWTDREHTHLAHSWVNLIRDWYTNKLLTLLSLHHSQNIWFNQLLSSSNCGKLHYKYLNLITNHLLPSSNLKV